MFDVFGFNENNVYPWLKTDELKSLYAIPPNREDCILMMYIGLKDDKGQAIFEGDILSINQLGNVPVVFYDGCFGAWNAEHFAPFRGILWGLGGLVEAIYMKIQS